MKVVKANLLSSVGNTYDQTRTTIQGRVVQKNIAGTPVLGPPLNSYVDTIADTLATSSVSPASVYATENGRIFTLGNQTAGVFPISLHTIDYSTGVRTFIGTIRMVTPTVPANTPTPRGFKVLDDGVSGWRIYLSVTSTIPVNAGLMCAANVALTDFLPTGPGTLFPFAIGLNQKATYFMQDPSTLAAAHLAIANSGLILDKPNSRVYFHNGSAATHQYYVHSTNTNLDCPTTAGLAVTAATDRVSHTAHGFTDNTSVFISAIVNGGGLTNNTVYFVRNSTANDYQLSATSGGAAINVTSDGVISISRAFGMTGDGFLFKTGNLPILAGVLLGTDSEDYAVPGHTTNSGQPCAFFATSTNLYLGRLSELSAGSTLWPNLVTSNVLSAPNQVIAPSLNFASWSNVLDKAIFITNGNIFGVKSVVNNSIDYVFGGAGNLIRENNISNTIGLQTLSYVPFDVENGWLIAANSGTTGQRGLYLVDLRSDVLFDHSFIVTRVLDTPSAVYKFINTTDKLFDFTGSLQIEYRTSGFGSITGGWTPIIFSEDLSAVATGAQVQFRIRFATLGLDTCIPAQISELFLGFETLSEISDNWEYSDEFSDNNVPSRTAFRLKKTYSTSVPQLFYRAYDLTDALLITNNTTTNAANFEFSTNNGVSWSALGVIPNTVGTLIRYTFTSPPGVDVRPSIKES